MTEKPPPDLRAVRQAALLLASTQMLKQGDVLLRRVDEQRERFAKLFGPALPSPTNHKNRP